MSVTVERLDAARILRNAFVASGADRGVIYLSVPITTGRRLAALAAELHVTIAELRVNHPELVRGRVQEPNERDAREFARNLRDRNPQRMVVDPSPISIAGWSQADYHTFWMEFIEEYAAEVAVAPGWVFSAGARAEVGHATKCGIPVTDLDARVLTPDDLSQARAAARDELLELGFASEEAAAYLQ